MTIDPNPDGTAAAVQTVSVTIDGTPVVLGRGETILDGCNQIGIDTPTLCYAENLTPVNACRLCVVEVEDSRTLVPACSRPVEDGMVVSTGTPRVTHARKTILEFLATGVDLSQADELAAHLTTYGADPGRYPEPAAIEEEVKVQDGLYIRDYDKCVLCYKCVEACGDDAQHTYAISLSGRGFGARISTEFDTPLPESACVYCGNCIAVCPTNALQTKTEYDHREAGTWRPDDQSVTQTVCSYCGVGCNLELHTQDNTIVNVTSPVDHPTTKGHLCIKGRFGYTYVQPPGPPPDGDPETL